MFDIWIDPSAYQEIADLPGHIRQRVRRAISALVEMPRPSNAKQLTVGDIPVEAWRLRLDQWRVIYTVDTHLSLITVWAVRKRPPYNYNDLLDLLKSVLL